MWWISSQSIIYKLYHTTRSIDPMWHITYALCVDHSRIQSLIFILVNLVSSHALSQYIEVHKEFFIWLHALGLCQSYLSSWDHHDIDIEPYLKFFSCRQTLKILKLLGLTHKLEHGSLELYTRTISFFLLLDHIRFISSIQWSWCQYLTYIFIFMASKPWIQHMDPSSNSYEQFIYIKHNDIISP
jgi:hypothetical protein